MQRRCATLPLIAICLWIVAACSSPKTDSPSSGSANGVKKTVKNEGDDNTKKTTAKDCPPATTLADDTANASASDSCSTTTSSSTTTAQTDKPLDPDGALYESALNPPELKACHALGKVYDREKLACIDVAYPATYACDKAGVLGAFSNDATVASDLDAKEQGKWLYDQCGSASSKPYVLLVCFTTDDQDCAAAPVCKAQADLDLAAIKVCTHKIAFQ